VLLPPDFDEDDHSIIQDDQDEEKGLKSPSGSWSMVDSPLVERRITPSAVGSVFSTKQWEMGGWRRGSARSLFGLGGLGVVQPAMGIGLGISETNRERKKRLERTSLTTMGWKDVTASRGLREEGSRRLDRFVQFSKSLAREMAKRMKEIAFGRPIAGSFWRRMLWDGLLVAVPSWLTFALVTWYLMN
jgi:hypothetical protein